MTARDRLLEAIDFTWCNAMGYGTPEALVDAYAHELAEKIRDEADADTSADTDICTCWRSAADFIDPEES